MSAIPSFNAKELLDLGVKTSRSHVVSPIHGVEALVGQPESLEALNKLDQNAFNVLAVGRVVPNKGFDLMMTAFADAIDMGVVDFHLHLVGSHDPRLQSYIDLIGGILATRGVRQKFSFHGSLSSRDLATFYRHSDVFWTTSLHEGFCVPAIEAMAFGLPILSSRHAALPETCGDAAFYGSSSRDFAKKKLVNLLVDDEARHALGKRGRQRYEALYRGVTLKRRFLETIDEVVRLTEVRVPITSLDLEGEWFGLPNVEKLLDAAFGVYPCFWIGSLEGLDHQSDFIDWILTEGWSLSEGIVDYVRSQDFLTYAREIEVPNAASYISVGQRLVWKFHRRANARFDLRSVESVADYLRWYEREAKNLYFGSKATDNVALAPPHSMARRPEGSPGLT